MSENIKGCYRIGQIDRREGSACCKDQPFLSASEKDAYIRGYSGVSMIPKSRSCMSRVRRAGG